MEEESVMRDHGGRVMEKESLVRKSCRRDSNHGGESWKRFMEQVSWRRNHGGSIEEASGKHLGDIWEASGRHLDKSCTTLEQNGKVPFKCNFYDVFLRSRPF